MTFEGVTCCDWCEEPSTMKRGKDDICGACDERLEEQRGKEWEQSLSRSERLGWQRARDADRD